MAIDRVRGQETSLSITVDGILQSGSFTTVDNFKWSPRQDLTNTGFLGEPTERPDLQHHGFDFSFSIHEIDNAAVNVLINIVNQELAGAAPPNMNLVFIKRYMDPALVPETLVFEKVRLKLDSQEAGSRKDFIKTMFSGSCEHMELF